MTARSTYPLLLCAAGALSACASDLPGEASEGPRVETISTHELVVGQTLYFVGEGFEPPSQGINRIRFTGRFEADDGSREDVDLSIQPIFDGFENDDAEAGRTVLRWSRFGPFGNPFSSADRPGVFRGAVRARFEPADGAEPVDGPPTEIALEVLPSIIIEAFEPLDVFDPDATHCGAPAVRGLGGLPYRLSVRAVGIRPVAFEYSVGNVNGDPGLSTFVHDYRDMGPVERDELGRDEPIIFNPVPAEDQLYVTGLRVIAYDEKGRAVETALPFSIHRPLEVRFDGKREVAELLEPIPVSGCINGGLNSRVSYSETKTETRQLSLSVTVSNDFLRSTGTSQTRDWQRGVANGETTSSTLGGRESESESLTEGQNVTYSNSASNNVDFSTTNGEDWSWNMNEGMSAEEYEARLNRVYGDVSASTTATVEGEASVAKIVKVGGKVSSTVGVKVGGELGWRDGGTRGTTSERGWGMGGTADETSSFGSTATDSRTQSIAGAYTLGRSRSRDFSDTRSRESTRTYNFSEGLSSSEVISEGMSEAEQSTWIQSSSDSTTQTYTGLIPNGQVGIFYRQTTRWVRRAGVVAYNRCGVAREMGELQFNEWTWAPDLATGADCDSAPPRTNLPPAQCFVPPCGE